MLYLISYGENRPSMLTQSKDEVYHLQWARYCTGQANTFKHNEYLNKIALNKSFYRGDQWVVKEDVEAFLKDDEGQDRNRLKVVDNVIKPMVEQFRGNAIRMDMNAKCKSISKLAVNRREQKLAEMLFFTDVAQKAPQFAEDMKANMAIGDNAGETEGIFENLYVDGYVEKMNNLLQYCAERNKFQRRQVKIASEIALAGIGIMKNGEYSGHLIFDPLNAEDYFWDRTGKEDNLSDSEFMGDINYVTEAEIFEMYPDMSLADKKSLDSVAQVFSNMNNPYGGGTRIDSTRQFGGGRFPVFNVYWKDSDIYEYGYVTDPFGYPFFTRINYVYEGEEVARYTDKDLIKVDSIRSQKILEGKMKKRLYVDTIRFAKFIPSEIVASDIDTGKKRDILLEHGVLPYQETNNIDFGSAKFPYNVYTWAYMDGEVLTPIDDAINPQRMINRLKSVAENQINNSGGSGIMYDKSFVDPADGEDALLRNLAQSKPVGLQAKGRGMQNAVVPYDNTINKGTMVLMNLIESEKTSVKATTGLNEALQGTSTGSDQLVGVTELMIQRGSLIQEPFYNAISEIYLQCFETCATVGKRIYADNERELAIIMGDDGVKMFQITKDMKLEDFRVFVKRENKDESLVSAGNSMLLALVQMGMLNQMEFANLYGRSTPDQITIALRKSVKQQAELNRAAEKKQAEQDQAMMEQENAMMQEQKAMVEDQAAKEDIKFEMGQKHDIDKIYAKSIAKMAEDKSKSMSDLKGSLVSDSMNKQMGG